MNGFSTSCVCPNDRAVAHALEEVQLGGRAQGGDLLAVLRHRLHVLLEDDHVKWARGTRGAAAVWSNSTHGSHCAISDSSVVSLAYYSTSSSRSFGHSSRSPSTRAG